MSHDAIRNIVDPETVRLRKADLVAVAGKTANKEFAALMTAIDPTWRAAEVEVLA